MRSRLFVPTAVALFGLLIAGVIWLQLAGAAPSPVPAHLVACGTCHSMEQEVATWQVSPHSNVACLQCHTEADVSWIRHELLEKEMAQEAPPHTIKLKVPNERCLDCHGPQMDYLLKDQAPPPLQAPGKLAGKPAQPMAIRAMHELHVGGSQGISCGECHLSAAHGPQAKTVARVDAIHSRCQSCHDEKQVSIAVTGSTSCSACHVDLSGIQPKDHVNAVRWRQEHGKASAVGSCADCHLGASAGPHTSLTNPAAYRASSEDTCLACHGVAMPHPAGWVQQHTAEFKRSSAVCANCHGTTGQGFRERYSGNPAAVANTGICRDCHVVPMPHPASFLSTHGAQASQMGQVCEACHSSRNQVSAVARHTSRSFCASCHEAYQHPTGWVAAHGGKVTDSCATCHTVQGRPGQHNSCSACHSGSTTWHPKMWFVNHGNAATAQGEASCAKCHDYVKPSCAECHRSR